MSNVKVLRKGWACILWGTEKGPGTYSRANKSEKRRKWGQVGVRSCRDCEKFYLHSSKQQTEIIKLKFLKSHSGELMRGIKNESRNTI